MAFAFPRWRQAGGVRSGGLDLASPSEEVSPRFEAFADALLFGGDLEAVCAEIGSALAADGASLAESLDGLERTAALGTGQPPDFAASRALAVAWSEASLQYLHALSCEDPLTGLASLAHLRSRIAELYREADCGAERVTTRYALVVVELSTQGAENFLEQRFGQVLRLAGVAECMRTVFPGGETLARLGPDRAAALVPRAHRLARSVSLLRQLMADWRDQGSSALSTRVWIERLPPGNEAAGRLLDELAR